MLLVLIILQLLPAPAKEAMADAVGDRHSWQVVRTELNPQWTTVVGRIESRRPTITLVMPAPVQPAVDPRSFSFAPDLPAGARLANGLLRDVVTETAVPPAPAGLTWGAIPAWDPPASPAEGGSALLGDLRSILSGTTLALTADIELPTVPDPTAGGRPDGFPGSGIGASVPEPAVIPLTGLAVPLILSRRRRWQNPAK
jgi:hypothetical protein